MSRTNPSKAPSSLDWITGTLAIELSLYTFKAAYDTTSTPIMLFHLTKTLQQTLNYKKH